MMQTWLYWQHWDCEVSVAHFATEQECYDYLANWLDECDDDCEHSEVELTDHASVREAVEWHYDELSWEIQLVNVPVAQDQLTAERVERPRPENQLPAEQVGDLLGRLESYTGSS